jgi:ribonuclease HI
VETPAGAPVAELYGYLGRASNNVAEYQALIHALRYALSQRAERVRVFSDSELVVRQMSGQYRVKHPDMLPLFREASTLRSRFREATLDHVRREHNKDADRLANKALDTKESKLA